MVQCIYNKDTAERTTNRVNRTGRRLLHKFNDKVKHNLELGHLHPALFDKDGGH